MAKRFRYEAVTTNGAIVRGVVEGKKAKAVTAALVDQGLRVHVVAKLAGQSRITLTNNKIKLVQLMHFSRQMAAFIRAGVPVIDGIDTIRQELKDKPFKKALGHISDALRSGDSFAAAMATSSGAFPDFFISALRSAELTGQLDTVLDRLAIYIERSLESRRKIRSTLAYPIVVVLTALLTVVVLAGFVMPRFKVFFESFDAQLPLPTRIMLGATDFVTAWWYLLAGGLLGVGVALYAFSRTRRGRHWRDRLVLKVPLLADVLRHIIIERFCRILASMVQAGVPLPDSLRLAAASTNNHVYEKALGIARDEMMQGGGISAPMKRTRLFPGGLIQMMRVGEDTGTLDEQLEGMATFYEKELEYKLKNLTTLIEPAAILTVGLLVGFVAVALVSAMYGIYSQVQF